MHKNMNMNEAITALLNSTQLLNILSNEFIDIEIEGKVYKIKNKLKR